MPADDELRGELRGWWPAVENLQGRKSREGITQATRALWRFGRCTWGAGSARLGSSAMIDGVGAAELIASAVPGPAGG
jgi:hypothetical protein